MRDLPKLTARDAAPPHHRDPIPVVFDPKGKLLGQRLPAHFLHFVGEAFLPKDQNLGPNVSIIPHFETRAALFQNLKKALNEHSFAKPLQSVMVEGGATLLNGLLEFDMIDAIHQFTGPREFSSQDERYRIKWKPTKVWDHTTVWNFGEDSLQEWRKRF